MEPQDQPDPMAQQDQLEPMEPQVLLEKQVPLALTLPFQVPQVLQVLPELV